MFKPGQWRAICDVCGFKFWSGDLKKRWDGLMVCSSDFEHDHPQKYLRVHEDKSGTPWTRPPGDNTFIYVCYEYGTYAYAGLAEAGCAKAGKSSPLNYTQALALKQGSA